MIDLLARNGHELLDLIETGDLDHNELQEAQFRFARKANHTTKAFIAWDEELEAQEWYLPLEQTEFRKFHRLPYAVKDNFTTTGITTTAASQVLSDYLPPYDATAVAALRHEKNHLMGKTNHDEFAMGSSGETSAHGVVFNPWSMEHVPGGSSSGSAAAVAACQCVMALGTDTGGSVRLPASFCGIVGYKPTYGMVSRYGMIAYASSCDQAGILARNTLDVALTMNVISQPDPADSTCQATGDIDFHAEVQREVHWNKLRVGVPKPFLDKTRIEAAVLDNFTASLDTLSRAGVEIIELEFPLLDYCLPAYYIITCAECSSNLARYDGIRYGSGSPGETLAEQYRNVRDGFGAEVKRRILLGTYVLSSGYYDAYYDQARRIRSDISNALATLFTKVDVLAMPTAPTLPFKFGERMEDPVKMYMSDLCTVFVNMAGTAGISLPNGFGDQDGVKLPTGLQLVCAPFRDSLLLRVAHQFEKLTGWHYTPPDWVTEMMKSQSGA